MEQEKNPAAQQWPGTDKKNGKTHHPTSGISQKPPSGFSLSPVMSAFQRPPDLPIEDTFKRKGFFEAISTRECPTDRLWQIIGEIRQEAIQRLQELDAQTELRIVHLNLDIERRTRRIEEWKTQLEQLIGYSEKNDEELQQMMSEKVQEEKELKDLQEKLTAVRIKLGEAKSGIIDSSLEEAENQVRKALGIQKMIFDETYEMNKRQHHQQTDAFKKLDALLHELYGHYKERHEKIKKQLSALDMDGISSVTSQILVTIGYLSFTASGLFFSIFAGVSLFGKKNPLSHLLDGLVDTISGEASLWIKLGVFLGLMALVTLVSFLTDFLIRKIELDRRNQEAKKLVNEISLQSGSSGKTENSEYQAELRTNNWFVFWLQIIPFVLLAGLVMLGTATKLKGILDDLSAGPEGVVVGTFIAMSLAGLIYLYLIKIVEPRMLKKLEADSGGRINWVRANLELCVVFGLFAIACIYIIAFPYIGGNGRSTMPEGQQTQYAIALFMGVSLVGGICFAYGTRSRGLIEAQQYLEWQLKILTQQMAYYSVPSSPDIHATVHPEHGNLLQQVLRRLSFNATVDKKQVVSENEFRRFLANVRSAVRNYWSSLPFIDNNNAKHEKTDPVKDLVRLESWEEKYFPHIVDELKAVEFKYREKKDRLQKKEEAIDGYRSSKKSEKSQKETEIGKLHQEVQSSRKQIENVHQEKDSRRLEIRTQYMKMENDLHDGFQLGIWYRENHIGPRDGHYESCGPSQPLLFINNPVNL